jgi:hypothetical protein
MKLRSILEKLNAWHELKVEQQRLREELERKRADAEIEEAMSGKSVAALLELLKEGKRAENRETAARLEKFLLAEFKSSIKFDNRSRASAIIECVRLVGTECAEFGQLLAGHLTRALTKEKRGSYDRMRMLVSFGEYDSTDGLGTSSFIEDGIRREGERFEKELVVETPLQLDRWLNEAVRIHRHYPEIAGRYREAELEYFSMCLELIRNEKPNDAMEDLVFLLNKVRKRSKTSGVDVYGGVLRKVNESGLAREEDIKRLCEGLYE